MNIEPNGIVCPHTWNHIMSNTLALRSGKETELKISPIT
jgi:hypothetical protein